MSKMERTVDLNSVRTFVCIVESGSFTSAARLVGRTQSAISMQIQRLEELLGGPMFERGGGALTLSKRGECFLPLARKLIEDNHAILEQMRSIALTGSIRLGVCDDFAEGLLAGVLRQFSQMHSQVNLELTIDLSVPLLDTYKSGALDLAVVKRTHPRPKGAQQLLTRADLTWIAAPGFRHIHERPLRLPLFPPRAFPREIMVAALRRAEVPWVAAATCHSLSALRAAVAAGIGVSAIARNAVFGGVEVIQPHELPELPCAETVLLWKSGTLTPAVERLRKAIIEGTRVAASDPELLSVDLMPTVPV